uniref:Uncharacterized protein n=1 Tax=Anguilla anguilla TaxID=7936 RepID=A0A0E9QYT5_ANGAN
MYNSSVTKRLLPSNDKRRGVGVCLGTQASLRICQRGHTWLRI